MTAGERVRIQMDVGKLGTRPVEDELQDGVDDFDSQRPKAKQRRLIYTALTKQKQRDCKRQ